MQVLPLYEDFHDAQQLIDAVRALSVPIERIVTAQETLLELVAVANEALGLGAMPASTVRRVLDKSQLKATLETAAIETARHHVITDSRQSVPLPFPLVLKPLGGSGALTTWRVRGTEELRAALTLMHASPEKPILAEECLAGRELCIDTITIDDEPRFHSICCYRPSILEACENSSLQWTSVMPRDMREYQTFIDKGLQAVRALRVGNAMTHMEGFLMGDGSVRFIDATLRPAGARIGPMLAYAYDIDPRFAWARAAVDGAFDGPWERAYAVGTIFLRGAGSGCIEHVDGIDAVRRHLGDEIVDVHWPRPGMAAASTYTGDGYVTVRHRETEAVEEALQFIAGAIAIHSSDVGIPNTWQRRLDHFEKKLYRPAWEHEPRGPIITEGGQP